jgi:hypothetical protein
VYHDIYFERFSNLWLDTGYEGEGTRSYFGGSVGSSLLRGKNVATALETGE